MNRDQHKSLALQTFSDRTRLLLIGLIAGLALSGCGGGGGTDTGAAAPPATVPATVVCNAAATAGVAPSFNGKQTVVICPNVFVEASVSTANRASISATIKAAADRDKAYYGTLLAPPPDVVVCQSVECGTYFAGPSLRNVTLGPNNFANGAGFVATRATIVLTGIAADTENVLTHEGSHVELAARIGGGWVPAWFNEGLATMVGGAPDCTGVTAKAFADLRQVDDQPTWNAQTNSATVFLPAYCQARAEVVAWTRAHPAGAVESLLDAVKSGTPFYDSYGAILTQ